MTKFLFLTFPILLALTSCSFSRSSGARSIREIEPTEAVIYTFVGEVHGWSGWAGLMNDVGVKNAKSGALEEAAELDANYIVWNRPTESILGTSITGRAYTHKFFIKQPTKLSPVYPDSTSVSDDMAIVNYGGGDGSASRTSPGVAENGDVKRVDNDGDGRAESVHVKSYTRKDGTYVPSHYRAKPRK